MTLAACQRLVENLIMASLYAYFFAVHWNANVLPPILAQEGLLAVMFLIRRQSVETSPHALDWGVAIAGSFLPLTMRASGIPVATGVVVQFIGFGISIASLAWLNRSFGIVAANRGVQTAGVYRIVRHPMYVGHIVCLAGYVGAFPSVYNGFVAVMTALLIEARIEAEERVLMQDAVYRTYAQRTRWRLLPGVY